MVLQILYGSVPLQPLLLVLCVSYSLYFENLWGAIALLIKLVFSFQTCSLKVISLVLSEYGLACLSFYKWQLVIITVVESQLIFDLYWLWDYTEIVFLQWYVASRPSTPRMLSLQKQSLDETLIVNPHRDLLLTQFFLLNSVALTPCFKPTPGLPRSSLTSLKTLLTFSGFQQPFILVCFSE